MDNGGSGGNPSPWSIGAGSGETPNLPYGLESSNKFFGGEGSLASLSAVSGSGGDGGFTSADSVSVGESSLFDLLHHSCILMLIYKGAII